MSKFPRYLSGRPKYVTVRSQSEEGQGSRAGLPDGLWTKCEGCGTPIYHKDLAKNLFVCEKCGFHHQIGAKDRIAQIVDDMDAFEEVSTASCGRPILCSSPITRRRPERIGKRRALANAIMTGKGTVGGYPAVLIAFDFFPAAAAWARSWVRKLTRAFERATEQRLPVIAFPASGGARMQEGIFSLMQMQKTAWAVETRSRAGLLYISVLTDPTLAGVYGSFAALGDIIIAEPKATDGFAGPSVITETIRRPIPPDLQSAETVFANGFIDRIVPRTELKVALTQLLPVLAPVHSQRV